MKTRVRIVPAEGQTDEGRRLAKAAAGASQRAIAEAFVAGLPITVVRGNRIVRVASDGTETFVQNLPSLIWPPCKRFRLIAGPNGSGKSTLIRQLRKNYAVNFYTVINANDILASIQEM